MRSASARASGRYGLAIALGLTVALAVVGQQLRPLLAIDEPRYLAVAWDMWLRGDWLVPHLNGAPYTDKGPLLFWLINLAWMLFGVSETAARIVPAIFAVSSVVLTATLAGRLWPGRPNVPGHAALILAGTGLFALFSTLVMFDALLTTCVLVGMLGLDAARRGRALSGWCLYGAGIGLGLLAKGPVVLVHLLPAALLAPAWIRDRPAAGWARWYLGCFAGAMLGVAAALAWAVPAAVAGGAEYRQAILWAQSVGRVIGSSHVHARPPWFYVVLLPALLFPWLWWPSMWRAGLRELRVGDDSLRLLAVWVGCGFLILSSIAGKQVHYLMPLVPAVALAAGRAIAPCRSPGGAVLPIAVSASIGSLLLASVLWMDLGHTVPGVVALFPLWSGPAFLALAACLALVRPGLGGVATVAALCPAILLLGQLAFRSGFDDYDLGDLARSVKVFEPAGIAFFGSFNGELVFGGRLERPIATLSDDAAAREWIRNHPGGLIVGPVDAGTQALELSEVYRRPYRDEVLGVWLVPRPDCSPPDRGQIPDSAYGASVLSPAAVALALAGSSRSSHSHCG